MSGSVLTIGNFDGVHAGHRQLLRRVVELAKERGLTSAVLTFDPHPTRVVAPQRAPRLLTTMNERCELLTEQGIERIEVLPFTPEVAQLTPEQFVASTVAGKLQAKIVLVGENFRFGNKQAGNTRTLSELGAKYGYETHVMNEVKRHGRIVSSSEIRRLIEAGDVAMAARLLERPYALSGEVVSGHGIGSKQTVPTLNLSTKAEVLPARGVYITHTHDPETGEQWNSITNIGFRPTFGGEDLTIETFLLSPFDGLTPEQISVEFLRRVRDERKFDSPEALKWQILADVGRAQTFFRRMKKWVHGLK